MKLKRLYSNVPAAFPAIEFLPGLNVVLAEIRLPENQDRDTHNLGKTTLASVLDFCLLKKRSNAFFLFRHEERFRSFEFYLELCEVGSQGRYLTIRRSVERASKVSFLTSDRTIESAVGLQEDAWSHWEVPFDRARILLDGMLDLVAAQPWDFRKPLGYALRLQNDYKDVFQLDKYKGKHADWKPLLAHLLGLDGKLVKLSFDLAANAASKRIEISQLEPQLAGLQSPDDLDGLILLRQQGVDVLERQLKEFDFKVPDEQIDKDLVGRIEADVAELNQRRYHLRLSKERIVSSLGEHVKFDIDAVQLVFADAQIYFGDQLRRDYDALMAFLKSISTERGEYLRAELVEIEADLEKVKAKLSALNAERVRALEALRAVETFEKYRRHTERLVNLKTTVGILDRQREAMTALVAARRKLAELERERELVVERVEQAVAAASKLPGRYRAIRLEFGRIVKAVLDRDALLSTRVNGEGNVEFSAEIVDGSGVATSADHGHTYKKLLCIAFDMALFSSYLDEQFVHFVYHDGVLESLDDRKKVKLLHEIRAKCDAGLQQIITLIDSDLPVDHLGRRMQFATGEIIKVLHDEGPEGRLFRMDSW